MVPIYFKFTIYVFIFQFSLFSATNAGIVFRFVLRIFPFKSFQFTIYRIPYLSREIHKKKINVVLQLDLKHALKKQLIVNCHYCIKFLSVQTSYTASTTLVGSLLHLTVILCPLFVYFQKECKKGQNKGYNKKKYITEGRKRNWKEYYIGKETYREKRMTNFRERRRKNKERDGGGNGLGWDGCLLLILRSSCCGQRASLATERDGKCSLRQVTWTKEREGRPCATKGETRLEDAQRICYLNLDSKYALVLRNSKPARGTGSTQKS